MKTTSISRKWLWIGNINKGNNASIPVGSTGSEHSTACIGSFKNSSLKKEHKYCFTNEYNNPEEFLISQKYLIKDVFLCKFLANSTKANSILSDQ